MKKLFLAAIVAITAWLNIQAQGLPAPEKFNEYLEQVAKMDQIKGEFLMTATMESLSSDPMRYRQMMELAEKRFSDPADPIHNEGLYMAVLKHTAEKFVLSGAEREKQRLLFEGAKKNMVGTVAADFDFITPKDKVARHLRDLKSDYILVYFNNPDCESCEKVKERLANSELINKFVNDKKLIVLAIYPYEDHKLWKKAKYPSMMINGWNESRNIEQLELYDLPTLPCLYLLDKDYKVLIKNEGSLNKVEAMLQNLMDGNVATPAPEPAAPVSKAQQAKPAPQSKPASMTKSVPVATPAPADDPNTTRSEQMFGLLLENNSQGLYDNLSELVKSQATPETFEGVLSKVETQLGKYQSHEPWQIQELQGQKAYTSIVNFEKAKLGMVIVYDEQGKMLGFNLVPAQAIKAD